MQELHDLSRESAAVEMSEFSAAFHANMTALHMPVPTTLFATLQTSIVSVAAMMDVLKTLGADATVGELIGATTKLEGVTIGSSILASIYLGAVIGSLMVATDASSACGVGKRGINMSLAVARWGTRYGLAVHPWVMAQILRHPEVLAPGSHSYLGLKASTAIRGAQ
ncbi:hypothetical protein [Burkholderia anthina]|uniref:hypothetical protein n=1 Tax=Burkholderia anthina TaxID=179879 RepID=UPI001E4BEE60|nr:hypothetical protein [Burkholderia anthina]